MSVVITIFKPEAPNGTALFHPTLQNKKLTKKPKNLLLLAFAGYTEFMVAQKLVSDTHRQHNSDREGTLL